uniref:Uncharacterized protein n=1 Tax=Anopheles maculatus TaxID=74869 RepID=A0A182T6I3_9DIPT
MSSSSAVLPDASCLSSESVKIENILPIPTVRRADRCTVVTSSASNRSESSSTLSYRASLFGEQDEMMASDHGRAAFTIPRFSPRDFPTSWIGKHDTAFSLQGKLSHGILGTRHEESAFQPFGSRAHLFHKNKSITGKHGILPFSQVEGAQLAPNSYHSLNSSSTLRRTAQMFGGSCPEIYATSDTLRSQKSYSKTQPRASDGRKRKSKIVELLERNENDENDENREMAILQEYFDTMSYTEIVKDRDFRNYLMKKRYLDIMEYIYNSSAGASESGQFSRAPSTVAPPSLPVSNNDCDSVKKEKLMAESVPPLLPPLQRFYSSNTNSQVFCRRNSSFEQYYQTDSQNHGGSFADPFEMTGNHRSIYSTYRKDTKEREKVSIPSYATLLKEKTLKQPSRCQRTYRQIRAFCEKSLMKYSLNRSLNAVNTMTLKRCKPTEGYSEKKYRRVIDDFVRQRGFSSVDEYTRYHYGDFLRQKMAASSKRSKRSSKVRKKSTKQKQQQYYSQQHLQYNSLPPPPYSSGDYHQAPPTPISCESKATPPLARNAPTNLLFESDPSLMATGSSLPNVSGNNLIYADTFKHFDYVSHTMTLRGNRKGDAVAAAAAAAASISSASCRLDERRQIFLPVNSDGEDDPPRNGAGSPFLPQERETLLLGDLFATSDQTNQPYIFDDIGVYETIRSSNQKEMFRAEMKSRKDILIKSRNHEQHEENALPNLHKCGDGFQKLVSL